MSAVLLRCSDRHLRDGATVPPLRGARASAAHAGWVVGMTDNDPTPAVSGVHVLLGGRRLAAYEHLHRVAFPVWPPLMKLNPGCRDRIAVFRDLVR